MEPLATLLWATSPPGLHTMLAWKHPGLEAYNDGRERDDAPSGPIQALLLEELLDFREYSFPLRRDTSTVLSSSTLGPYDDLDSGREKTPASSAENPSVKRSRSAAQLLPTPGGEGVLSLLPSPHSGYCEVAPVREEESEALSSCLHRLQ
ncbi:hypothetical protein B0H14DRAFT_2655887 [Mycena olivaceomarginata]|nr:hypothetical protein B0H14DRAFT_2655887 [Mycena olivaceomarginata]